MKRNQKYLIDEFNNIFRITKNGEQVLCSPKNKNLGIDFKKISYLNARTLLNKQWAEYEHEWVYNGDTYKTFPILETTINKIFKNPIYTDKYGRNMYLIEYHGKLYKITIYGGYYPQVCLYDLYTDEFKFWTNIKNCKTIYKLNKETNKFEML